VVKISCFTSCTENCSRGVRSARAAVSPIISVLREGVNQFTGMMRGIESLVDPESPPLVRVNALRKPRDDSRQCLDIGGTPGLDGNPVIRIPEEGGVGSAERVQLGGNRFGILSHVELAEPVHTRREKIRLFFADIQ
jgi:hypothetical protein